MSETNVCKIGYHWTCINMYGYVWICMWYVCDMRRYEKIWEWTQWTQAVAHCFSAASVPHLGPLVVDRCAGKAPCAVPRRPRRPRPRHRLPGASCVVCCIILITPSHREPSKWCIYSFRYFMMFDDELYHSNSFHPNHSRIKYHPRQTS